MNNFMNYNYLHLKPWLKIIGKLGNGSFGDSFLIENTNSRRKYATKISYKTFSKDDEKVLSQIELLSRVKNPAILKFIDIKQIEIMNENHITITTEYITKKSLENAFINDFEKTIKYINILGIAFGMEYLHSQNIIHGNLKLENILLDYNLFPLICDFGLSKLGENNFLNYNSIIFTSPEVLEFKERSFKSDVYSYAMIVYSIITGEKPVIGSPLNIIKGKRPDLSKIKERKVKNFLQKCWSSNPEGRPSFDQIIDILIDENFYCLFEINFKKVLFFLINFREKQSKADQLFNKLYPLIDIIRTDLYFEPIKYYKIVLLGNSCVGKTALINTYE